MYATLPSQLCIIITLAFIKETHFNHQLSYLLFQFYINSMLTRVLTIYGPVSVFVSVCRKSVFN